MKKIILNINLIISITFIVIQQSYSQQLVEGIAAIVGEEIVLKTEVEQYVQQYAIQNRINLLNNEDLLKNLQKQVLDQLVEQKMLLVKADEDTIIADDRDVDQRVEQNVRYMIQQVGSEDKLEEAFQKPIKKIKRDLRQETIDRIKIETLRRKKFQGVKITRREVEIFYNTYKDSLPPIKETVDISHILKQVKAGEASSKDAFEKVTMIRNMLLEGSDFAELAKQYSEDPGSAKRGGDLGFTKRGDFVKEYEQVAFTLELNQVSDIVRTQYGFHIIKLIEKRGESIRTSHVLIQVKPTSEDAKIVIADLEKIRKEIIEGARFDSLAMIHSEDENVAKDKGNLGRYAFNELSIHEFKNELRKLELGEISHPFKTDYGYHILMLNKHEKERNLGIENDWEQVYQVALNFKIEKENEKWIKSLKEEIPIEYKLEF